MKDIIIVGIRKAGNLHLQSYLKIENRGSIFLVDCMKPEKGRRIYKTVTEVMEENKLDPKNVIVDICTPKSVFLSIIEECIRWGVETILVEKPFLVDKSFFQENSNLKIIMVQNYLYSLITDEIKKQIKDRSLKIKFMETNFSKNRIEESKKGRGMTKENITRNIEIEIPHQIYLANSFFQEQNHTNHYFLEEKDLCDQTCTIKKHGYGKIICQKGDCFMIHESDLTTHTPRREIILCCENNISVKGEYLIYDPYGKREKEGKVQVMDHGKIIMEKVYQEDDNMFFCILDAYHAFHQPIMQKKYKQRIIEFNEEMKQLWN